MWIVIKYKIKEFELLKKDLIEKIGTDIKFYTPKIKLEKLKNKKIVKLEKFVLGDYLFCHHQNLKDTRFLNVIKNGKGIKYILDSCLKSQKEIIDFIDRCKNCENEGYLTQKFFYNFSCKKAMFISGPFTNTIFEIIEKQKNKLKILIGDFQTSINKNSVENLYLPI